MTTPWQRVVAAFGGGRGAKSEIARAIGKHRSTISRYARDPQGLISGQDQVAILRVAHERGIRIKPADLVPTLQEAIGGGQGDDDDGGRDPDTPEIRGHLH